MLAKQMKLPDHLMVHLEANSLIAPIAPSSCQSGGLNSLASQEVNDYKQPQSYQLALFLHDPKERVIVAIGMWYPQMRLDHNKPMSSENVRVSVDKYEQQYRDVLVPVPSSKIKKLHQAHGSFVQWPKELVDLSTNEVIRNENTANKNEVVGAQRKEVANGATIKKVVTGGSQSKKIVSGQDTRGSFTNPKKAFGLDKEFQHLERRCPGISRRRLLRCFVSTSLSNGSLGSCRQYVFGFMCPAVSESGRS
ncbi:hypothetical protein M5689_013071 [Euphorbia peplus]|nr:hypothetical protein M5689_013071 [Euphorbia peplus]